MREERELREHNEAVLAADKEEWKQTYRNTARELDEAREQLKVMRKALEEIAAKGDQVVEAPDGSGPVILAVDRQSEECAAIARSALTTQENEKGRAD